MVKDWGLFGERHFRVFTQIHTLNLMLGIFLVDNFEIKQTLLTHTG
jgi:hypothetical protein